MGIQRPQLLVLGQKTNCSRSFAFEFLCLGFLNTDWFLHTTFAQVRRIA
jgi:hypothetical protein